MAKTESNIIWLLIKKFAGTISDDLNPRPMKGDKMRINLKPNAEPKKVMSARRVPLRYKTEADKVIADLIHKGVKASVSRTTDWCSPAFFVPKSDNIRMRLVTDYTHLNRFVKRPVHPFPCTKEVRHTELCNSLRQVRRSTWILPADSRTEQLLHHNVSTATRKVPVPPSPNGTQCLLR